MNRRQTLCLCLLFTLSIAAAAIAQDAVVAQIGRATISRDAYLARLNELRRAGDASLTLKTLTSAGRTELLNALIDEQLYAAAARAQQLDQDPATRQAIEQAVSRILAAAFERRELATLATTDRQAKAYYDAHPDEFTTVGRVKARHILLETRAETEAVHTALAAGADFAKMANERSVDRRTGPKGGELGWVSPGTMVKAFDEALFRLKPREISQVVQTSFGYHLITVDEIAGRSLQPFETVKPRVRDRLAADHFDRLRARLKTEHPVTIHRDVVETLNK